MTRPQEKDYTSHTSYTRALEAYCDSLEKQQQFERKQEFQRGYRAGHVYDITGAEPPPPDSGFAKL